MYVLAECGLIHKYLLKKEDVKRIEEETFFTVTIVKELDGYQVIEDEDKITLSNGGETLVFKKADRAMWDFVYYLDEYSVGGPTCCKSDTAELEKTNYVMLEKKVEEINKVPTWSPLWFKKAAKEILGTDEISLQGKIQVDEKFIITVTCDDDISFNVFKKFLVEHTELFGMTIIIHREYVLPKEI